jgi:peroxiredoxin
MKHLKRTLSLLLTLYITASVAMAQNYKVEGATEGIADGTWLYLRTAKPEKKLDSAKVVGGKFILSGKLDNQITEVAIYTAKYTNYVFFWLESKPMSIALKNGEFKKAIIKGSDTQTEKELIKKLEEPISKKEDSLYTLLNKTSDLQAQKNIREQINAVKNEEYLFYLDYIQKHPNSLNATNVISIYTSTWGKEKAMILYQHLSPAMKKTSFGQNIYDFISLNKVINIGKPFVDFEQMNVSGKKIKLSQIKGKYILLEFWASWCGPCREENPALVKTYTEFKDKGFAILGVSADDNKESWLKAVKDDQLGWENVSDLNGDKNKASLIYGITGYPTNYLIDEKGIIIAKNLRGDDLKKKLSELLP